MPIQVIWGNDLNASNKFIQKIIDQKVSKTWGEINISYLNGDEENQIKQAFDEILTPPLGDGSRVVVLKNNPIFTNKNDEIRTKFEKIYQNIPSSLQQHHMPHYLSISGLDKVQVFSLYLKLFQF